MATISENFSYPIIVKKTRGRGIMKVDSQAQMEDLVAMFDDQQPLLLQEMIAPSYGRVIFSK
jgi:glutathione synthase/RimK-type ligase-like ATP-grasp enzyme